MGHAARKSGITSVPMNYRLSPDEAAYVTDNSDALVIWADAEYARAVRRRSASTRRRCARSWSSAARRRRAQLDGEDWLARRLRGGAARCRRSSRATMIYTSGTTGKPKGAVRTGQGNPEQLERAARSHRLPARRHLPHHRPALPLRPGRLHGHRVPARQHIGDPAQVRSPRTGCACSRSTRSPARSRRRRRSAASCSLPDEIKNKYDRSSLRIMIANAAPWPFALKQQYVRDFPPDVAVGGLRLDRARRQHGPRAQGPDAQARLVRQARADGRGRACSTTTARRSPSRACPARSSCASKIDLRHLPQGAGEVRSRHARRPPHRRRRRLPRRGGLLLHLRSQEGHDHLGRREHLPRRDRGRARGPPGDLRSGGVRHPERRVGRERARGGGDGARLASSTPTA